MPDQALKPKRKTYRLSKVSSMIAQAIRELDNLTGDESMPAKVRARAVFEKTALLSQLLVAQSKIMKQVKPESGESEKIEPGTPILSVPSTTVETLEEKLRRRGITCSTDL